MSETPNVKEIFADAVELPTGERQEFLRRACGGNPDVMTEVIELIAVHERAHRFLWNPPSPSIDVAAESTGSVIGRYKLLEVIGEGGFGTVYLAEQREPVVRRVALKIIKPGMDNAQVIGRFEAERQALALMDHPNIAKVLDAGATESGRPYFVMELVKGEPITQFSDTHMLTIPRRLDLFQQVCNAVQHAHTKGVIHRDIKPSNVLVAMQDGKPLARVIDFGIAKATDHRLTERTVFTEHRQLIGTPEYMSPEQAEGSLDIDTRTDVYSLGVLLYELLTGSTPFDPRRLRSAAYAELQRIIREVDPPKPSTRLSQAGETLPDVASRRSVQPERLGTLLRGELDWIVMKALEKERGRRYETASGLATDLRKYLAGEPVSAAPPSVGYQVRKFVRRNRAGVVAASLVLAALVLGIVGTSIGLVKSRSSLARAQAAEAIAVERFNEAEKARLSAERYNKIANSVTEFFTIDVLSLDLATPGQPDLTVRQVLDRVPEKIQQHFSSEPAVEGTIRERVGQLYLNMGEPQRAVEFLEPAAKLLEQGLGPESPATLRAQQRLGELLLDLGRYDRAEAVFDSAFQTRAKVLGPNETFTLNSQSRRGLARIMAGRAAEGVADVEQSTARILQTSGAESKPALIFQHKLIEAYIFAGRPADGERVAREQLAVIRARPAELAPAEPDFRAALGSALVAQRRFDEAIQELDAARTSINAYPPSHSKVVELRIARGRALAGAGRLDEASVELEAAYAAMEQKYKADAERCREVARMIADLAARRGDEDAAKRWRSKL